MRNWSAFLLLVVFLAIGGLAQSARAGLTIDVVFQDGTGTVMTIMPGDPGPGCVFNGGLGGSVATGYCMDVVLTSQEYIWNIGVSVGYDTNDGLEVASSFEWQGIPVWGGGGSSHCSSSPIVEATHDTGWGGALQLFGCQPATTPTNQVFAPGTYQLGTIVWNTSNTTVGITQIQPFIDPLFGGIDFIPIDVGGPTYSGSTMHGALLRVVPEPGTASLLGLGLVGLVIRARSRRN